MFLGHGALKPCPCTPKCIRNIYQATVSNAAVSKAMLTAAAVKFHKSPASQSANRLEDYVVMIKTKREWATSLYQLSKQYSDAREAIFKIATNLSVFRREVIEGFVGNTEKTCLLKSLDLMNDAMSRFDQWEKNTYYLNNTLYSANFISRIANDVVGGYWNLNGFASEFMNNLQQIIMPAADLSSCNNTNGTDRSEKFHDTVLKANVSFSVFYRDYQILAQEVDANYALKAYQIPVDYSNEDYIR